MNIPLDFENIVFEGSATQAIAIVGALEVLEEEGKLENIKRFGGSSSGAMMAMALACKFPVSKIKEILFDTDFNDFMDTSFFLKKIWNIIRYFGIHKGQYIEDWLGKHIKDAYGKEDLTFQELFDITGNTLVLATTCLNERKAEYLCHLTTPELPIRKAVRMSISIPFLF